MASVIKWCGGGYGYEWNGDRTARAVTSNADAGGVAQSVSNLFDGLTRVESSNEATGVTSSVFGDLTAGSDGFRQWALTDLLGSVTGTADGTGQLTGIADYSDWGVAATSTDWDPTVGFGGETVDATLGLDLYFRRAYDPFTGTWGQADPYRGLLGEPRSLNRFGFVENNPVSLVDLAGFSADSASRWGGRSRSFFRSKSRAKKKKKPSWVTAVAQAVGRAFRKGRNRVVDRVDVAVEPSRRKRRIRYRRPQRTRRGSGRSWHRPGSRRSRIQRYVRRRRSRVAGPYGFISQRHARAIAAWNSGDQSAGVWDQLPPAFQRAQSPQRFAIGGRPQEESPACRAKRLYGPSHPLAINCFDGDQGPQSLPTNHLGAEEQLKKGTFPDLCKAADHDLIQGGAAVSALGGAGAALAGATARAAALAWVGVGTGIYQGVCWIVRGLGG